MAVPRFTFLATLGGLIARGQRHTKVFDLVRPGFKPTSEDHAANPLTDLEPADMYPDALPCLERLRAEGRRVAICGNYSALVEQAIERLRLPVDAVLSSGSLESQKPSPQFFENLGAYSEGVNPSR
ncbi:MAG: HAD family hydrolase [Nocardioidaceae bacterium]